MKPDQSRAKEKRSVIPCGQLFLSSGRRQSFSSPILYLTIRFSTFAPLTNADRLSATFQALADPTRRAILARLSSGAASVTELTKPFAMSMPAISKHLKVLERAQLITRGRDAQLRPCKLEGTRLKEASDWVEQYRHIWEARFDRLDVYLKEMQATDRKTRLRKTPVRSKLKMKRTHGRNKK